MIAYNINYQTVRLCTAVKKLGLIKYSLVFFVNAIFGCSIAHSQELPPIMTPQEAVSAVCSKWNGKTVSSGQQKTELTPDNCEIITAKLILGLKNQVDGMIGAASDLIRGDKQLLEARTQLSTEGMSCGEIKAASSSYFTGLTQQFECIFSADMTLKIRVYGDSFGTSGGFEMRAENIAGAIQIPPGSLGSFMRDASVYAGKAVVPGQSQLDITFDPPTITYREYYLRRPLSTRSGKWIGYVIKVMDYGMLKGHERIAKMIFPGDRLYESEAECYSKFEKVVSTEPLNSRYPQTSDVLSSYLYGCIEK